MTAKPHESIAVKAGLPPLSSSGTRTSTYWLPASNRCLVTLYVGTSSAAGTFKLLRAADSGGSSSESASATTAYGGTSTTGDNVLHRLSFDPTTYVTAAKPYLAVQIAAGGTYLSAMIVEELDSRYSDTTDAAADAISITTAPAAA